MELSLWEMRQRGYTTATLHVLADNHTAQLLYLGLGFRTLFRGYRVGKEATRRGCRRITSRPLTPPSTPAFHLRCYRSYGGQVGRRRGTLKRYGPCRALEWREKSRGQVQELVLPMGGN